MFNFFHRLYRVFFICKKERNIFNFFNIKNKSIKYKKNIILIQCVEDYYYYGLFGAIISSLKDNKDIEVNQYIARNLTLGSTSSVGSFVKSILLSNRLRDNKWKRMYSAYCDNVAFRYEGSTSVIFDLKAFLKAYKIYKKIRTKKQLLELTIENIEVGDLIYDSYLRFKPAPTVNVNNFYLYIVIWQSLRNIQLTKKYFNKSRPKILLTSYSSYIQHGITARIAIQFGMDVYSFGNLQMPYKKLTNNDHYHTVNFDNYKSDFEKLADKKSKLKQAEYALNARIGGKIDISTSYMRHSAYISSHVQIPDVKNSIVIFLHDFFDSPHIYGEMVFPDFLEWIEYTIKALEQYNIPYFLKPHPNQISDSQKVVEVIKKKYPDARFISSDITNKQLVDGGINAGISVYGTVAHELVYMGIPVVLCGENPHSSYNFCSIARNKYEYRDFIKRCMNTKVTDQDKDEVKSFYYMHNLNKNKPCKELMGNFIELRGQFNNGGALNDASYIKTINKIKGNKEFIVFVNELEKI